MSVPTGPGAVENDPGRPFIADDNGGQGLGPSLGGDLGGEKPLPPKRTGRRDPAEEDDKDGAAAETPSYDPTSVEVDLGREQGLGMGQRDLDRQRDPTG